MHLCISLIETLDEKIRFKGADFRGKEGDTDYQGKDQAGGGHPFSIRFEGKGSAKEFSVFAKQIRFQNIEGESRKDQGKNEGQYNSY